MESLELDTDEKRAIASLHTLKYIIQKYIRKKKFNEIHNFGVLLLAHT